MYIGLFVRFCLQKKLAEIRTFGTPFSELAKSAPLCGRSEAPRPALLWLEDADVAPQTLIEAYGTHSRSPLPLSVFVSVVQRARMGVWLGPSVEQPGDQRLEQPRGRPRGTSA